MKSLVKKENQNYIKYKGNRLTLDFGDMDLYDMFMVLNNDKGLNLLYEISDTKEKYLYEASSEEVAKDRKTGVILKSKEKIGKGDTWFVRNISVTPRNYGVDGDEREDYTVGVRGYQGHVRITPKEGVFYQHYTDGSDRTIIRASLVFHELAESFARTTLKYPYENPSLGFFGAHQYAIDREGSSSFNNPHPGNMRFKPNN